jgi:hypothetical protein
MIAFLLWCLLFIVCWPLALLALILYPIVWLLLLPFRIVGIAVHGALALVWAVVMLPARLQCSVSLFPDLKAGSRSSSYPQFGAIQGPGF